MPVWPARTIVVIGAILVVVSYAMHGITATVALISGRAEGVVAPETSIHL